MAEKSRDRLIECSAIVRDSSMHAHIIASSPTATNAHAHISSCDMPPLSGSVLLPLASFCFTLLILSCHDQNRIIVPASFPFLHPARYWKHCQHSREKASCFPPNTIICSLTSSIIPPHILIFLSSSSLHQHQHESQG